MSSKEPKASDTLTFVSPDLRKTTKIKCIKCKIINYSQKDYKMFHEAQKLSYFEDDKGNGPYCHSCIGPTLLDRANKKEVTVKIKYKTKEYEHTFYKDDSP
jgi:hypothetical protein